MEKNKNTYLKGNALTGLAVDHRRDGGCAGPDVANRRTWRELASYGESSRPRQHSKNCISPAEMEDVLVQTWLIDGREESPLAVERARDQGKRGKLSIA